MHFDQRHRIIRLPPSKKMASLRALQAYGEPILLQLVEGPQPQHAIEAPGFALEALREVGLVKRRMIRAGHVAEAYWYLWDDRRAGANTSANPLR